MTVECPMAFEMQQITIDLVGSPPPSFIWWTDLVEQTKGCQAPRPDRSVAHSLCWTCIALKSDDSRVTLERVLPVQMS
jgi:hypothetical protein